MMALSTDRQAVLDAALRELARPDTKYKLVATATPSNSEYWTVILISRPIDTPEMSSEGYGVGHHNPQLGTKRKTRDSAQTQGHESRHLEHIYHSEDKDALLGLCHYLLLDAVFRLWAFADSLTPTLPESTYTVKG